MKPYLVDVPVKINIWIRPEYQKKQFDIIKEARPSILFIQSDGGRNNKEWELIKHNREYIDSNIDWDCKVYRLYEDHNNGLYSMAQKTSSLIWSKVDRCIFTEDDQVPAVSFFRFCAELLEKYKDDTRIECICGVNQFEISDNVTADYFFSKQGSIWGIATWKRTLELHTNFDYIKDPYITNLLKKSTRGNKKAWNRISGFANNQFFNGHVAASEFWIDFDMYSQNMLQIIPKYNQIMNIGCGDDAQHSSRIEYLHPNLRSVFYVPTHEIQFPLKHPSYVISDTEYENKRNKRLAYGRRFTRLRYSFYSFAKALMNMDFKYIAKKLKNRRKIEN